MARLNVNDKDRQYVDLDYCRVKHLRYNIVFSSYAKTTMSDSTPLPTAKNALHRNDETSPTYGVNDSSYQAAGGYNGIYKLVDEFYKQMETLPEARVIRDMHKDLTEARKKLTYFLSGWLGGPRLYSQNYPPITIPSAHRHLDIGKAERDAWLLCMKNAAKKQPYAESFKVYLLEQLYIPAERSRVASENFAASQKDKTQK